VACMAEAKRLHTRDPMGQLQFVIGTAKIPTATGQGSRKGREVSDRTREAFFTCARQTLLCPPPVESWLMVRCGVVAEIWGLWGLWGYLRSVCDSLDRTRPQMLLS